MTSMTADLTRIVTFAGIPLLEALADLDRQLEDKAYKPITGGSGGAAGLTDISPAYMFDEVNRLFGPLGLGWRYRLVQKREERCERVKKTTGEIYYEWESGCRVVIQYRWRDLGLEGAGWEWSEPIPAEGGSSNQVYEWAKKGAETNGLGAAWSRLGWQASVYKGLRSHRERTPEEPPRRPPRSQPAMPPPHEEGGSAPDILRKRFFAVAGRYGEQFGKTNEEVKEKFKERLGLKSFNNATAHQLEAGIQAMEEAMKGEAGS